MRSPLATYDSHTHHRHHGRTHLELGESALDGRPHVICAVVLPLLVGAELEERVDGLGRNLGLYGQCGQGWGEG